MACCPSSVCPYTDRLIQEMRPRGGSSFALWRLSRESAVFSLVACAVGLVAGIVFTSHLHQRSESQLLSPATSVPDDVTPGACSNDGWTEYGDLYGPCNLCGLSHGRVLQVLAAPHSCQKDAFWGGQWHPILSLPDAPKGDATCIVFCAPHVPCRRPPCLLSMMARPGSSDGLVIRDVFFGGMFRLKGIQMPADVTAILDAGANIGAVSVYFSLLYPNSTVVSVEASSPNYDLLRLNTEMYPRVVPVHLALWSTVQTLCLVNGQRKVKVLPEYAFQVLPCNKVAKGTEILSKLQGVPAWFLLEMFKLTHFDILKVDIEGGEGDVFRKEAEKGFLGKARLAIIELHDDMWTDASKFVGNAFGKLGRWKHAGMQGEHNIWVASA